MRSLLLELRTDFIAALVQWFAGIALSTKVAVETLPSNPQANLLADHTRKPTKLVLFDVDIQAPLVQIASAEGAFCEQDKRLTCFRRRDDVGRFW